jgi:hypothetical protein
MSRRKKYTLEEVKEVAIQKGGECLATEYKNNKENIEWKCGICNHIWKTCFKSINIFKQWCPSCSGRLNNNLEVVRKLAKERGCKIRQS